jgi:hypothetical protein
MTRMESPERRERMRLLKSFARVLLDHPAFDRVDIPSNVRSIMEAVAEEHGFDLSDDDLDSIERYLQGLD